MAETNAGSTRSARRPLRLATGIGATAVVVGAAIAAFVLAAPAPDSTGHKRGAGNWTSIPVTLGQEANTEFSLSPRLLLLWNGTDWTAVSRVTDEGVDAWRSDDARNFRQVSRDPGGTWTFARATLLQHADRLLLIAHSFGSESVSYTSDDLGGTWIRQEALPFRVYLRSGEPTASFTTTPVGFFSVVWTPGEAPTIWHSRDGRTWKAAHFADLRLENGLTSVAAFGEGAVVVVGIDDDHARLALTEDGEVWTSERVPFEVYDLLSNSHLVPLGDQLLVFGAPLLSPTTPGTSSAWLRSSDGAWSRVWLTPGTLGLFRGYIQDVVEWRDSLVMTVLSDSCIESSRATRELFEHDLQARTLAPCFALRARVLISADGMNWREVVFDSEGKRLYPALIDPVTSPEELVLRQCCEGADPVLWRWSGSPDEMPATVPIGESGTN